MRRATILLVGAMSITCACRGSSDDAPGPAGNDAGEDAVADATTDSDGGVEVGLEWPNAESFANSDPWIRDHHDAMRVMRPKVLVLNFVNAKSNDEVSKLIERIFAGLREGSRHRGFERATAPAFLEYQIGKIVDLRDKPPPAGWTLRNSTLYPRRPDPTAFTWGLDYAQFFSRTFADKYGYPDPSDATKTLDLCGLVDAGLVHEVWIVGDGDVPDASAAEVLEWMPKYDASLTRIAGPGDRCAGNGCFDTDVPHCERSLRIGFVNHARGPGCYMESMSHGMEWMSTRGALPYLKRYFPEFAGFDLDKRYAAPFKSWYVCERPDCVTFDSPTSVSYTTPDGFGKIDPYVPVCGNAHFPPNARHHYDLDNTFAVQSTCEGYRRGEDSGKDRARPFTNEKFAAYRTLADDCMGPWLVWWRQNWPGLDNGLKDDDGAPMKNWYPFLFY